MSLYASVCNNTVVIWPLFIEVIVSFSIKKHREHLCNTGTTQGKHREFHFGYNVATLLADFIFSSPNVKVLYRSGMVNSKSFVGKVLLRIKWKFELTYAL